MSLKTLRKFTAEEFHRMAESGILSEDDRVELIEGEIVQMSPIGSRHASCVDQLNAFFSQKLSGRAIIRVQNPVRLDPYTELLPDLALLRPRKDFYASRHPGPGDVFLIVEVADTSAAYDREIKVPLYARSGIPEVWLVDLERGQVEVYRSPSPQGYREIRRLQGEAALSPEAFPDLKLRAADLCLSS